LGRKRVGGYILEEMIQYYMMVIRNLMDSGKLNEDEYEALEYAHYLALEEFYLEAQNTQNEIEHLKRTGMIN
jgi:hypothetical protein